MSKYINAHCHLQNIENLDAVLGKSRGMGVCGFICNAALPSDWDVVLKLTQHYDDVYGCVGIHPWYIQKSPNDWMYFMGKLLRENAALMVGEIGLDKLHPDIEMQESVFADQLYLAKDFNRSVHIHCVAAWDKLLRILKVTGAHELPAIVLHDFTGTKEILGQLIKNYNVYFSFSASVLDGRRDRLIELIKSTPSDRMLVESDEKEPSIVIDVVKKIADIKSVAYGKIADTIYKNTLKIIKNG